MSAATLILGTVVACDNMEWAGFEFALQPPPRAAPPTVDSSAVAPEEIPPPLPEGPILGVIELDGDRGRLLTVGELTASGLAPLASEDTLPGFRARLESELVPLGTEYQLFRRGTAVGRFVVDGPLEVATGYCGQTLSFPGYVELVPSAFGNTRLLGLPAGTLANPNRAVAPVEASSRGQRINMMRLYGEQIGAQRARWPSNVDAARRDFQVIDLGRGSSSALVSTFMFRDQLAVAEPRTNAYSMFIVAENPANAYEARYVWYRPVSTSGKGAPRFLDMLDWDGDGGMEMLLDVQGATDQWFAALDETTSGTWDLAYQEECGRPAPPPVATQP